MKIFFYIIVSSLSVAFISCDRTPDHVIAGPKMEDLLVDIHKAEAVMDVNYDDYRDSEQKKALREAVFLRHGVTEEQFDTSLVWYGHHIDKYVEMYDKVIERLKKENEDVKLLIARENEQTITRPGDSVDVWKKKNWFEFNPRTMDNILAFEIIPDENFMIHDRFVFRAKFLMIPRSSVHPEVYLAVSHENKDVAYVKAGVMKNGWFELAVQSDSALAVERVYGYVSFPPEWEDSHIYADSISLMRLRYKDVMPELDAMKWQRNKKD